MRKVALCISGQPRSVEEGFPYIKKYFLEKYNPDVFLHSWYDKEKVGKKFDFSIEYNRNDFWREGIDRRLLDLYNPKKYVIEKPKEFDLSRLMHGNFEMLNPYNVSSMFYTIFRSNSLKKEYELENNFLYDVVIRIRTDLEIKTFNLDLNNINTEAIHAIRIGHTLNVSPFKDSNIINDQLNFGGSKQMDIFSDVYNNLEKYLNEDKLPSMVGERVLTYHILKNNLPIHFYDRRDFDIELIGR